MGELCLREVVDFEFKAFCIVTDPFDKYSVLEIKDMDYNYEVLKWLLKNIENSYDDFSFEETKVKNPLYKNIGRNELCPCGSGKKYKKNCIVACILPTRIARGKKVRMKT